MFIVDGIYDFFFITSKSAYFLVNLGIKCYYVLRAFICYVSVNDITTIF